MQKTREKNSVRLRVAIGSSAADARTVKKFGREAYGGFERDDYEIDNFIHSTYPRFDPVYVRMEYDGKRMGFGFEYQGPKERMFPRDFLYDEDMQLKDITYYTTNEYHSPDLESALKRTARLTHYVGIAGGPDGTLARLGAISSRSNLKDILLIDRNGNQILCNAFKFIEYDQNSIEVIKKSNNFWAFRKFESHPEGLRARLEIGAMENVIKDIKDPGRYFIYLSNAFGIEIFEKERGFRPLDHYVWSNEDDTHRLLGDVLGNGNIQNLSYVMFAEPGTGRVMIIQKRGDTFFTFAFISDRSELDARRQKIFFDSLASHAYDPERMRDVSVELMKSWRR